MKRIKILLSVILFIVSIGATSGQNLSIHGNQFYADGKVFPMWGLRAASATQNERNTDQLISVLDEYKKHGLNAVSVYLQGSSGGYSDPFQHGGKQLSEDHLKRLERIIEQCQNHSMVVIVGIFYQRTLASDSIRNLHSKRDIFNAVKTLTKALKGHENVIINIANEQNSFYYQKFTPFSFNEAKNIIKLCKRVKRFDKNRIVGAGGYNDSLNVLIGKSRHVDVLLFDTYSGDVEKNQHSGWHYDYFRKMGVPDKPMINVEMFGGWTGQFVPPGVYTEEGKKLHTQEIEEALKRPGLHVHLHSNVWMQGPSEGYPTRYDLAGRGTEEDPGIRWWFDHLKNSLTKE
ncbi:hypothetical protein OKW21_004618 [Catalinimonas alkaloidigena]|uniref:cellulase family glycosylhydrolase n=1 Tax=Catalinimonas alkaloidigena TaxID=1075417 RepID=UPI002406821B|nr:cellulase family glycosylhydrolase [Catalinimonas alkaloidigena]MDF9799355.1 hypothetical protein [Catalinimonas alkaloidigena]